MDFWLTILARWAHIGAAIVVVGGSIFLRFVLLPAAAKLSEADHEQLRTNVMARWKRFVHGGIALFLISGFYNYIRAMPLHKGDGTYHMLLGIKMLLAFTVFILASGLVGRSKLFAALRSQPARWLGVVILLAAIIVGISGYVKVAVPPQTPAEQPAAVLLKTDQLTALSSLF